MYSLTRRQILTKSAYVLVLLSGLLVTVKFIPQEEYHKSRLFFIYCPHPLAFWIRIWNSCRCTVFTMKPNKQIVFWQLFDLFLETVFNSHIVHVYKDQKLTSTKQKVNAYIPGLFIWSQRSEEVILCLRTCSVRGGRLSTVFSIVLILTRANKWQVWPHSFSGGKLHNLCNRELLLTFCCYLAWEEQVQGREYEPILGNWKTGDLRSYLDFL